MKDWLQDFWDFWGEDIIVIIGVLVVLLIIAVMCVGTISISTKNACASLQSISANYQYHWDFWSGCRVNINGIWMNYNDIDLSNLNIKMIPEDK